MQRFSSIEAIILDKDGVFVDFNNLWFRIIAYRAQRIAEKSSSTSEMLVKIRTAAIRSMGIDEDMETVDPYGPCSMPIDQVVIALAVALYLIQNEQDPNYSYKEAFHIVTESIKETYEALDFVELSQELPGTISKINELAHSGFKLGLFTSDSSSNTQKTLEKFQINKLFSALKTGEAKSAATYLDLCKELKVKPETTLLITDSPRDLKAAKDAGAYTVLVLSGIVDPSSELAEFEADLIIDSLADFDLSFIESPKKKLMK